MKHTTRSGAQPLTLRERIDIEKNYCYGESITDIARHLARDRSTIYREIDGRPRRGRGKYQADIAHSHALERIEQRGNKSLLASHKELYDYVAQKLKIGWSPEQVSIRLPLDFPQDTTMRISYEAIYVYIYACIGSNGKVKRGYEDLRMYLPRRHKRRAKKGLRKAQKAHRRERIPSIDERPKEVDHRKDIGHWEDDLLVSRQSKVCIKSVNERKSGIVFFGKTADGSAVAGDTVLLDKLRNIPVVYRKTLTRDNGKENVRYEEIQKALALMVYYAHPYHSWERGSNEHCNGLLRRFFPKGTDFQKVTDAALAHAEYLINTRPRKRHGGRTPAEVFYEETGVALFP